MLEKWNERVIAKVDEYVRAESAKYLEDIPEKLRTPGRCLELMMFEKAGYFRMRGWSGPAMVKEHIRGLGFGDLLSARQLVSEWLEMEDSEVEAHENQWFEETYLDLVPRSLIKLARKSIAPNGWDVSFSMRASNFKDEPDGSVAVWMDGAVFAECRCPGNYMAAWYLFNVILDEIAITGEPPMALLGNGESRIAAEKSMADWRERVYPRLRAADLIISASHDDPEGIGKAIEALSEMLGDERLTEQMRAFSAITFIDMMEQELNAA